MSSRPSTNRAASLRDERADIGAEAEAAQRQHQARRAGWKHAQYTSAERVAIRRAQHAVHEATAAYLKARGNGQRKAAALQLRAMTAMQAARDALIAKADEAAAKRLGTRLL